MRIVPQLFPVISIILTEEQLEDFLKYEYQIKH